MKLVPTKEVIRFTSVCTGMPFYAHDLFWIKTSSEVARELSGDSLTHSSMCTFTIDDCDEYVQMVNIER